MIEKPNLSWNGTLTPLRKDDVEYIIVHHPAAVTYGLMDCHRYHRDTNGWIGIGYNYYMRKSGTAYEARGAHVGAHASGYNVKSIGVCVEGNYEQEQMQDSTLNAYVDLIKTLMDKYDVPAAKVIRHRDVGQTACPGKNFPWEKFKSMIAGKSSRSTTTVSSSSTSFTDLPASEKYKEIKKTVDDVAVLQRQLMAVGENLSRYGDDGVLGKETLSAIQSFQRKHNISNPAGDNYGRPGPSTQAKLDDLINYTRLLKNQSPMMRGEDVRQVQRVVGTTRDSVYGPKTASAVEGYQRDHGLLVDGIVGEQTFGHMFG